MELESTAPLRQDLHDMSESVITSDEISLAAQEPEMVDGSEESIDDETQDRLFQETQHWDTLDEFRRFGGRLCALVQNIPPSTRVHKVILHFQSKKRADGGEVKCVIKMEDGHLIVFVDETDCKRCLKRDGQKLGNQDISLYPKKFPTCYDRTFVIERVPAEILSESLISVLRESSPNGTTPKSCTKCEQSGSCLVEYGDDHNIAATEALLKNIFNIRLGDADLKARKLCRTECLKVMNVPEDVPLEEIRKAFQDIGQCVVTRISRTKTQSALVYFTLFEDAENICETRIDSILINGHLVKIELYHHSLSKDHENVVESIQGPGFQDNTEPEKIGELKPFQTSMTKGSILHFIHNNAKHHDLLQKHFEECAIVEIVPSHDNEDTLINFIPKMISPAKSQKIFEEICLRNLEVFLAKYSAQMKTFKEFKLEKARSLKKFPEIEENYDGIGDDIAVNWRTGQPSVDVIGVKHNVEIMVQKIETWVSHTVEDLKINPTQYPIVVLCGIVNDIKEKHKNVEIICIGEESRVIIEGDEAEVKIIQIAALSELNEVQSKKVTGLDDYVVKFLLRSVDKKTKVMQKIYDTMNYSGLQARGDLWAIGLGLLKTIGSTSYIFNVHTTVAIVLLDGELYFKFRMNDHYERAIAAIKSVIALDSIFLEGSRSDVVKCPEWEHFLELACAEGLCWAFTKDEKIIIVGIQTERSRVMTEIEKYLKENTIEQIAVPVIHAKARYILERSQKFSQEGQVSRGIACAWSNEDGKLMIKGKRKLLDATLSELNKLLENIDQASLVLDDDIGIKEHFAGDEGREFLSTIESENNCVIVTDTPADETSTKGAQRNLLEKLFGGHLEQKKYRGEELASASLPNLSVVLKVLKTDIIRHNCDAILCACDYEMKILQHGASGEIERFDATNGDQIQTEIAKTNNNPMPGDAMLVRPGKLQTYKKVIPVIAPRWNSRSKKNDPTLVLKACISNGLQQANIAKLNSVAIPAITCGEGGIEASLCAELILEGVLNYFKEERNSNIKQVHFVESSRQEVLNEFKKCVNGCSKSEKSQNLATRVLKSFRRKSKSTASSLEIPPGSINSKTHKNSPHVELVEGDITKQTVDVIVKVFDREGRTSLSRGLQEKLNFTTQMELYDMESEEYPLGKVLETNAGDLHCKKLYLAVIPSYDPPKSLEYLRSAIRECLRMAEVSGHQSIGIPAIATGEDGHPPLLVAKLIRQEILKFNGENPKSVTIVLDPGNQPVVKAFRLEFSSHRSSSRCTPPLNFSSSHLEGRSRLKTTKESKLSSQNIIDDSTVLLGEILLSISRGNATDQDCDVLVNITDEKFDLKQGKLSRKLLRIGGMVIQNDALVTSPHDPGYIETSGGNLPCKKIIHIVNPKNLKDFRKKITKVFEMLHQDEDESVTFSEFGFGQAIPVSKVTSVMRAVIKEYCASHHSVHFRPLKTVYIVTHDEETLKIFKKAFCTVKPEKSLKQKARLFYKKPREYLKRILPSKELPNQQPDKTFTMVIYSTATECIEKAKERILEEKSRLVQSETFSDDAFGRLTDWEKYEMKEVAKKNKVKIADSSDRYIAKLTVRGFDDAVFNTRKDIDIIIEKFKQAENLENYVTWERLAEFNEWEAYHPRAAFILEREYKERRNSGEGRSVDPIQVPAFAYGEITYDIVDLSELDCNSPIIRRRPKDVEAIVFPEFWQDMCGHPLLKVPLSPTSQEYQKVMSKFQKGLHRSVNSVKIERIQNASLYKQYIAKRDEVGLKRKYLRKPIERQLFHGTNDDDKILLHGFDRSYAGKNATVYGRGVYFASNSSYSNGYTSANAQGLRRMILADVVTGESCRGRSDMVAPPMNLNSPITNDLYDSLVDNEQNPSVFVIFKDASAYPTYRITYSV